jgi:hypothetical protein
MRQSRTASATALNGSAQQDRPTYAVSQPQSRTHNDQVRPADYLLLARSNAVLPLEACSLAHALTGWALDPPVQMLPCIPLKLQQASVARGTGYVAA